jgi:hypothetical protein
MNGLIAKVHASDHFRVECLRAGRVAWEADFENLCTTEGLDKLIDAAFKTGLASPEWMVGLVDGAVEPVFAAADTYALHAGWIENTDYTEQDRQDFVPGTIAAGAVDNADSRAVFTISEDGSIAGAFLTDGVVIYGEGAFSGGGRPVEEGDSLRVTVTASVV